MGFALATCAEQAGFRLLAFDRIGSTNAEALRLGREGERGPLWVVAKQQTAGRGRRGREWATPYGNLAASLLVRESDLPPATVATLGFVAGLALREALARLFPLRAAAFGLKWPNDLLADGAKLAGILLEGEAVGTRRVTVLGIGVNVAAAPTHLPYPATSLEAMGCACDAEALFRELSERWVAFERIWDEGRGFAHIRTLWLEAAVGLGSPLTVSLGDRTLRGVFETVDAGGQLVLRLSDGRQQAVAAGEVHFGRVATAREEA